MEKKDKLSLVVSDLDGTLLQRGESKLKQEFLSMIKEIKEEGTDFAVASGRPYAELKKFFSSVLYEMYFVCENGALIYHRGKVLMKKAVSDRDVRSLVEELDAQGIEWAAAGVHTIYTAFGNQRVAQYYKNEGLSIMKVQSVREIPEEVLRLSVCLKDIPADAFPADADSRYAQTVSAIYEDDQWMDIVAAGVNKGAAVKWLCEYLKISPARLAVFGDNENDIELLGVTENSYAMEWAKDHVKEHARHTTSCVMSSVGELRG